MTRITLPTPTPMDLTLIEQCDPSVRYRRRVELALVRKLCGVIIDAGNVISVNDGGDYPVKYSINVDEIIDACFAVDECWLIVRDGSPERNKLGSIYLVFGNDGWDAINDYHVSLEGLLKPVNDYAEQLSEWC